MVKIAIKRRSILTIILILVFSLIITFSTVYSQNEIQNLDLENVKTPTTVKEFIELFSRFEFSLVEKKGDELIRENYIKIIHEGEEKIQGVQTNKVILNGEGTDNIPLMKFWFEKKDDKLKKIIIDGQEIPPTVAENTIDNILQATFYPFFFYKKYNLNEYEEFDSAEISESNKVYNEKEYRVVTIKMNNIEEYGLEDGVMKIADFNDFLLVVAYDVVTLDGQKLNYNVESLELK